MRNTKVIILCAGDATRWGSYLGLPKQLIPIGDESLLDRTVRLLRAHNLNEINIVSHDDRLNIESCSFFKPLKHQWVVETLLSTQSLWGDKTIILLGDVFFTESALNTIISGSNKNIHFYGRCEGSRYTSTPWGEIFALSFGRDNQFSLIEDIQNVISDAALGGRGKLWELYRSLANFPLNKHMFEKKIFIQIDDFTDDFDTPDDYKKILKNMNI